LVQQHRSQTKPTVARPNLSQKPTAPFRSHQSSSDKARSSDIVSCHRGCVESGRSRVLSSLIAPISVACQELATRSPDGVMGNSQPPCRRSNYRYFRRVDRARTIRLMARRKICFPYIQRTRAQHLVQFPPPLVHTAFHRFDREPQDASDFFVDTHQIRSSICLFDS